MFNMFVVALAPFKSRCYFLFIYHVKNIGQVSPLDLYLKLWYRVWWWGLMAIISVVYWYLSDTC